MHELVPIILLGICIGAIAILVVIPYTLVWSEQKRPRRKDVEACPTNNASLAPSVLAVQSRLEEAKGSNTTGTPSDWKSRTWTTGMHQTMPKVPAVSVGATTGGYNWDLVLREMGKHE